jgi:hypothetical protein
MIPIHNELPPPTKIPPPTPTKMPPPTPTKIPTTKNKTIHPHDRHLSKTTIIVHNNKWKKFNDTEKTNILLWPIFVILLIIIYVVYVTKFNKGDFSIIAPGEKNSKKPKSYIQYSNQKMAKCPNLKTIGVITYPNADNRTVYSITGNKYLYNNVITLRSGRPDRGFYSCNQNGACLTYSFITKNEKCTNGQSRSTLKASDNCIGGYGCHYKTTNGMGQQHLHTYCKGIQKTCPLN